MVKNIAKADENRRYGKLSSSGIPALSPDALCTIIKVEFDDVPRRMAETDLAEWISG